ncbi:transcriptional regulator, IclR family [Oscillibacter sp. PC13]|uniref:IclR family transcriptional regulator n=1 Tax=Oscillibacter sp. PC13 TaxID=1855299 RepID=UPI0008E90BC8|nr:IclR family transcriptional regulator [Oscillibacter sp. PC13]SFP30041.1 transcriptional regulator, IclR family [Oscillibacter sp. PC13]
MATTKNIQSVERAFAILESFQQHGGMERSVKEISEALGLNKSTTFGLINTLTNLGYLQQNTGNQKYVLGLKLLSFSNTIKVQNSIIRTVHPYLEQINHKYGETAHCAVEHQESVIYLDKVEATGSISINTQIGTQNYMHCTGVGKCILAYMPTDYQENILSAPLKTMTYNTITNSEQLREEIRKIRESGFAIDNEEVEVGLSCVAVPVFSAPDKVACSISISGMTPRVQIAMKNGLIEDLKHSAASISKSMFGYEYTVSEIK